MKILYFTATGNNLSVAKRFDAELLSIPQMIKNKNYLIEDDRVGIIYPIYALSVPLIVKEYLEKTVIKAKYVFVIATYGFTSGASLHEMHKILDKNGNHADYYESLLMVDNFLPFFDVNQQDVFPKKDFFLSTEVDKFNFVLKLEKDEKNNIDYIKKIMI